MAPRPEQNHTKVNDGTSQGGGKDSRHTERDLHNESQNHPHSTGHQGHEPGKGN